MCEFSYFVVDGDVTNEAKATVLEYIQIELDADNLKFETPSYSKIYEVALSLIDDFYRDINEYAERSNTIAQAEYAELVKGINPVGHSIDAIKQEEDRILAKVTQQSIDRINKFRMSYLEKKLLSHPDDDVRQTSSELITEPYTLSRIHTQNASITSDFEKLPTLIPQAINNWKLALVEQQIKDLQKLVAEASISETEELLKKLQRLFAVRSQLSQHVGHRVVMPK